MSRFRFLTIWLLAALILGAGMPVGAGVAESAARKSCCPQGACHCDAQAPTDDCGCSRPGRAPREERAPRAPAPRIEQMQWVLVAAPDPVVWPRVDTAPRTSVRTGMPRQPGVLPSRSRQEVLSVWRC
ncbi:MAG: hypothetical protein U1F36_02585 [Planctomycetota bacterium]